MRILETKKEPQANSSSSPPPHTDDLYFGKFTKEEYEDAKKIIQEQISKLEGQIKGDYNVRENLGKFSQFLSQRHKIQNQSKLKTLVISFAKQSN